MADLRAMWKAVKGNLHKDVQKKFKSDLGPTLDKFEKHCEALNKLVPDLSNATEKDKKQATKLFEGITSELKAIESTVKQYQQVLSKVQSAAEEGGKSGSSTLGPPSEAKQRFQGTLKAQKELTVILNKAKVQRSRFVKHF